MDSRNNSSKQADESARRNQPLKMSIKKMNSGPHKEWNSSEGEELTPDSSSAINNEPKEIEKETEMELESNEEPSSKNCDELHWDEKGINNEENCYCYCKGGRTGDPMLKCGSCGQWFHQACLKTAPRRIYHGEWRFTKLTCANCSSTGEEVIDFEPVTWKEASTLALLNLIFDKKDTGRIYYAPKEVSEYISKHWEEFCRGKKRTATWWSTISSSMTTGAKWFMRPPKEQEHLYTVRDFPNVFPEFVDFLPKISKLKGTALSTSSSSTPKKKKKRSTTSSSRRTGSKKRKSRNEDEDLDDDHDDEGERPPSKQRRRTGIQWLGESKETLSSGDVYYKAFTKEGQVFKLLDYVEIEADPGDHPRVVRIIDLLEKDGVKVMSAQHLYTKEDVESLDGKSHKHKDPRELFLSFQTAYYTLSSIRSKCYVRFVSRNQLKGIRRNAYNDTSTKELRKWLSVPGHYYLAAGFNISKKKLFYLNEIAVEKFNLKTIDSSDESYATSSTRSRSQRKSSSRVVADESEDGSEPENKKENEEDEEISNRDDEEPEVVQEDENKEDENKEDEKQKDGEEQEKTHGIVKEEKQKEEEERTKEQNKDTDINEEHEKYQETNNSIKVEEETLDESQKQKNQSSTDINQNEEQIPTSMETESTDTKTKDKEDPPKETNETPEDDNNESENDHSPAKQEKENNGISDSSHKSNKPDNSNPKQTQHNGNLSQ